MVYNKRKSERSQEKLAMIARQWGFAVALIEVLTTSSSTLKRLLRRVAMDLAYSALEKNIAGLESSLEQPRQ
jgi:hypothetical protein